MKVFDAKISLEEAGLFAFLMSNLDEENYVNISINEIVKRTALNRSWLKEHLKKLEEVGLVYIPKRDNETIDQIRIFCHYKAEYVFPF